MRELDERDVGGPIGARLAALRLRRGLTRDDLTARTGLEFDYVAGLEAGGEWVDRRGRLAALAAALRLDVADLTGQPYPPCGAEHAVVRAVAFHLRRRIARPHPDTAAGLLLKELAEDPGRRPGRYGGRRAHSRAAGADREGGPRGRHCSGSWTGGVGAAAGPGACAGRRAAAVPGLQGPVPTRRSPTSCSCPWGR
ncbi:helix-turn-helix domain-containing protein [Streptomyces sp. NPDC002845]